MSATLRSLRFYLVVGLAQGLLLMWAVLYSGLSGVAMSALAAGLLLGGGLLQLLAEQRRQPRTWISMLLVALGAAGLVWACSGLPFSLGVGFGVMAGLLLMTLLGATLLQGRDDLWRRLLGNGAWVLLALPMPWLAQWLFKLWIQHRHLDPFKSGLLSLAFFAAPTLAFSGAMFLGSLWRARRRAQVA
ncbi:hypothetical protein [Pseudomonas chlororaphis]|uniref:Uncharacterized protein n=1 Tax=Pseudomonas chlororaphis TaxID=587753 RepID=A0AAX3FW42_9PSED|nr:hypothetical protein [Pseudomonas chlororaphis]AZC40596.1 hypothetical protein C4K37_6254 [Pseudomonas chlororaphis subsp. piscium]AZC47154.1 hypothetical protein C4K36_6274 [Pseudomonas chlororaphis subsp. piscium]WDG72628.1 hypothetical protein PUP65_31880 [Pseudomonas chlororaphis]WDH29586.1 hypothetical protein PUP81_02440 [Pseudomonas chlororaphis]WDH71150.1 hypothetical protein PUP78_31835 [Pseudomonas chlororaphis]